MLVGVMLVGGLGVNFSCMRPNNKPFSFQPSAFRHFEETPSMRLSQTNSLITPVPRRGRQCQGRREEGHDGQVLSLLDSL